MLFAKGTIVERDRDLAFVRADVDVVECSVDVRETDILLGGCDVVFHQYDLLIRRSVFVLREYGVNVDEMEHEDDMDDGVDEIDRDVVGAECLRPRPCLATMRGMLRCSKLCELSIVPGKLGWPWVGFSPDRGAFAVPVGARVLAIRAAAWLDREARVALPEALSLPAADASHSATTSRQPGLHAVALHPDGRNVVALGWHRDMPVACVNTDGGSPELVDLSPALGDMGPMAATFTRDGQSLWVSAESPTGAAIVRLRFRDFGLESKVAFPAPPPPAAHEVYLHPVEDAVLLTMACGQDGTFVRVARVAGGKIELVAGEGSEGLMPCGLSEATDDGVRVCFVSDDLVELRRWPDLRREASYELEGDLVANYNGVRVGGRFVISAEIADDKDDERALVLDDTLSPEDDAPAPPGMWAGRLGPDRLVTIGPETSESRVAYVYAIEV